jgi:transcriptional regulator with GAF, ATPase, and Fis domain
MRLLRREGSAAVPLRLSMGESAAVALEQVDQVAASRFAVVIEGETGTGKELVGIPE